ncbi:hypothetical protein EXS73_03810 [Candidatus Pacearchaeota archaeon]|nr:hypothetical protein [Candidatus Pacearchaeota archaeon]
MCQISCDTTTSAPVCGSDGISYITSCLAGQARVSVACQGSCPCSQEVVPSIILEPVVILPALCGDKVCDSKNGETRILCPVDCPSLADQMCTKRNGKWDAQRLVCVIGKTVVTPSPDALRREVPRAASLDGLKKQKNQAAVQALLGDVSEVEVSRGELTLEGAGVILGKNQRSLPRSSGSSLLVQGCINDRLVGIDRILNWLKCVYVPSFLHE